jgi:hypothetical protein
MEIVIYVAFLDPEFSEPKFVPHQATTPSVAAPASGDTPTNPRIA